MHRPPPAGLFSHRPLHHAMHAALLGLALLGTTHTAGATEQAIPQASAPRHYTIPAGPLGRVLANFASQAGLALAFEPSLTEGLNSPGLNGSFTPQAALQRLLTDSRLEPVQRSDGSYTLKKQAAAATGHNGEASLPPLVVSAAGERESAVGPFRGYAARRSATATKTDTPILEIPQSISVIGQEEIEARGVSNITETLRYVAGVQTQTYGHDDAGGDWFSLRGFGSGSDANFRDGLKQAAAALVRFPTENYGLERVEVLRGPSSGLYGAADIGGIVHRVSKQARPDHVNEIGVQVGNYAQKQLRADLGGALGKGGHAWRVVGLAHENEPQADYPGVRERKTRRLYIAPSLLLELSERSTLRLLSEFWDKPGSDNPSEFALPGPQRSRVLAGDPSFNRYDLRQWSLGYQFEHRFNDAWHFRQNLRTAGSRGDYNYLYFGAADSQGNIFRGSGSMSRETRYTAVDNQLQGKFNTGPIAHTLLAGLDYLHSRLDTDDYSGSASPLNLYRPVYGQPNAQLTSRDTYKTENLQQLGVYAQDQMALGPWRLSAGLRHDSVRKSSDNHLASSRSEQSDQAVSGRIGANYIFANGLAPYASYGTSFLPQSGSDRHGKAFTPTRGEQYEIGVKFQPAGSKGLLTAALFDLTKQDVTTPDPVNRNFSVQTGEIRSRGLELEARQELLPGLNLIAQYTLNDVKVSKSNDSDLGKTPLNTPRLMASAWLDYSVQGGELRGLGGGLGARYRGDSYADSANTVINPAHTLFDAALWYKRDAWTTRLNISNLTDKDYISSYAWSAAWQGSRRTVNLSVNYRF